MPSCLCCGLLSADPAVTVSGAHVRTAVARHCAPSPYVYAAVCADTSPSAALCVPCHDWLARLTARCPGRRQQPKQMVPMDVLLCFMFAPDLRRAPDARNLQRLLHALRHREGGLSNPYTSFTDVADMVARVPADAGCAHISTAWWQLNGHCELFADAATSAAVRRASRGV